MGRVLALVFGSLLLLPGFCGILFLPIMLKHAWETGGQRFDILIGIPIGSVLVGLVGVLILVWNRREKEVPEQRPPAKWEKALKEAGDDEPGGPL